MTQIILESANPQELILNQGSINLLLVRGDNTIGLVRPVVQTQLVNGANDLTVVGNNDQATIDLNTQTANISLTKPDSSINLSVQENIVSLDSVNSSYELVTGVNQVQLGINAAIIGITESKFKFNINLIGLKDGINLVYTIPHKATAGSIRYYRNGVRQRPGIDNDYIASESGGVGSGFDTITLLAFPPMSWEELMADYITI